MNRDEYVYKISSLNRWFAFASLAFLATALWMIWDDYDRSWKAYQHEFFRLEAERAREDLTEEEERVAHEGALQSLEEELARAGEALSSQQDELEEAEATLKSREARLYRTNQDYSFSKAILETERYEFEKARSDLGSDHQKTLRQAEELVEAERDEGEARSTYEKALQEQETAQDGVDRILGRRQELLRERSHLLSGVDFQ